MPQGMAAGARAQVQDLSASVSQVVSSQLHRGDVLF